MKKRILPIILSLSLITTIFSGCNKEETYSENNKIKIVASNYVLADFAKEIGGDNVDVTVMLNPGQDSTKYSVANKDIAEINEADIFIYNGNEADPWYYELIEKTSNQNLLSINAAEGINIKTDRYNDNKANNPDYIIDNNKKIEDVKPEDKNNTETTDEPNENDIDESLTITETNDTSSYTDEYIKGDGEDEYMNAHKNTEQDNYNDNNSEEDYNDEETSENQQFSYNNLIELSVPSISKIENKKFTKSKNGKEIHQIEDIYDLDEDDPLYIDIKNYLNELRKNNYTEGIIAIYNGVNVSLFRIDNFYGDNFYGNINNKSEVPDSKVFFSDEAYRFLYSKSQPKLEEAFSELTSGQETTNLIIKTYLSLMYDSSDEDFYYLAIYDNTNNLIRIFEGYTYLGKCNNLQELARLVSYGLVGCDSTTYKKLNSTNAITEPNQYYNYWMNPLNAKIMVENIYNGIILLDTSEENQKKYEKRFNDYNELLDSLDNRIKSIVNKSDCKFIVLTGDFECFYLLNTYNIEYASVYDLEYPSEPAKITTQSNIISIINNNKDKINYLLSEGDNTISEAIKAETGVDYLTFNSLVNIERKNQFNENYKYIKIMEDNYVTLQKILLK